MKWLICLLFLSNVAFATTSQVIPAFLEASEIYLSDSLRNDSGLFVKPEIRSIVEILEKNQISPEVLSRISQKKSSFQLPPDDEFDKWTQYTGKSPVVAPEVALHAFRFDVVDASDDMMKDDIYAYYFITDGVIPTGKVTSIYKGLGSGESFFFNEVDRAIYPLVGITAKSPENHLIVDYGIIESDGDDIKDLQKLSSIIIDIAIAVYTAQNPQGSQVIVSLRKEIKALTDLLLTMNNDDRLAIGSFGYKASEIEGVLGGESYVEFKKNHQKKERFGKWEYDLHFRLLRK